MPFKSEKFSWMVKKSARICVGWYKSVKPFQTGTPEYSARVSTVACLKPLYSIPSYILPKTLAVSLMVSFLPICEPVGPK